MPAITFILRDGRQQTLSFSNEANAMELAVDNGIPGIDAACGGYCSCATCHVYVESGAERLPAPAGDESAMLAKAPRRDKKKSRLACQIALHPALDGLVLRVAERS